MVYDCWHATPEDHGNHRGLGAANRRGCRFVCSECAEFRNLPNVDDHITLSDCAYLWKLRTSGCARESAPRLAVYWLRRLESNTSRHCELWRSSRPCPGSD